MLHTGALLVLDLDGTLIHAGLSPAPAARGRDADFRALRYHVYRRPDVLEFLDIAFARFDVAVWTASTRPYAVAVLAQLAPVERFAFIWTRDDCEIIREHRTGRFDLAKNIERVRTLGYDPRDVIVVDDLPQRITHAGATVVPIATFEGDPRDRELGALRRYLQTIAAGDADRSGLASAERKDVR